MATVLPSNRGALGSMVGAGLGGLGQGIGSGIENIINLKLKNMERQQKTSSLSESFQVLEQQGVLQPGEAQALANIATQSPELANIMLKEKFEGPAEQVYGEAVSGQRAPTQQAPMPAQQLPGVQPAITEQQIPQQMLQQAMVPGAAAAAPEMATPEMVAPPRTKAAMANKLAEDIARMKTYLGRVSRKNIHKLQSQINHKEAQLSKIIINEERERNAQDRFGQTLKLRQDEMKLAKDKFKSEKAAMGRKEEVQKQDKIDKEYKPLMKDINKKAEAALTDRARYLEMKRINEEGDLGSNAFNIFADALEHGLFGLGINLTSLQTADAQAMKKLSKDFVKNVKEIIGTSRITQAEIMLYLSTIPNLMQSPEGRARIIDTNLELIKLSDSKQKMASDLIKKNGDKIPANFDTKLFSKMRPKLEKFEKNILKVANKAKQNIKVQQKQKGQTTFKDVADYGSRNMPTPRSTGILGYLEDIVNYGSRNIGYLEDIVNYGSRNI